MRPKDFSPAAADTWYGLPPPSTHLAGDDGFLSDNPYYLDGDEDIELPDEPVDEPDDFEGMADEIDAELDPTNIPDRPEGDDSDDWTDWRKAYDEYLKTLEDRLRDFRARGYTNVARDELRTALEFIEWSRVQPADAAADDAAQVAQQGLQDPDNEIGRDGAADFQNNLLDDDDEAALDAALVAAERAEAQKARDLEDWLRAQEQARLAGNPFEDPYDDSDDEALMRLIEPDEANDDAKHDDIDRVRVLEPDELEALNEDDERDRDQMIDEALHLHDPDRALDIVADEARLDCDVHDLDILQDLPAVADEDDYDNLSPEERRRYWRRASGRGAEPQQDECADEFDFGRRPLIDGPWNRSTYVSTLIKTGFRPQIDTTKRGKAPAILSMDTPRKQAYIQALKDADAIHKGPSSIAAPHHWREVGDKLRLIFNGKAHGEATKRPPPNFHMHSHKHIRRMAARYAFGAKFDLKNAFFTIKINEDYQHMFGVRLPDGTYFYRVLPMGYSWCPFI